MKIAPTEVIQAIQQENVQAAAGKIGGRPVPTGQDFELPITLKGRLEKASEFEEIIVRRGDDGSIVRIKDVARVELSSENFESASYIDGKPAGGILIYQYADANALAIIHTVREEMDHLKTSFPEGLDYTIVYNTTDYVDENIKEVQHTLVESFVLVMIVVFVFLQGFRATIIPMLAIPVSLVATFAVMAAFGFSINSLTLCGLVLAIGLVVDDAIIVVENVEKYLHRGLPPLEATRAAMAEITTPIVTITLVLAAVFVPVAFMPGMTGQAVQPVRDDDRLLVRLLGVQLALVQPGDGAAVPPRRSTARPGSSCSAGSTRGCGWIENSYDAVLEWTAHHWWTIVVPSVVLLGLTGWMIASRPKAFIPTEDQGYLICVVQTPDGTSGEKTAAVLQRVEALCRGEEGVEHTVALEGLNVITSTNQTNCGVVFAAAGGLARAQDARAPGRRPGAEAPGEGRLGPRRHGDGPPAAPDPRPEPDRRLRADDRGPLGQGGRRPPEGRRPVPGRGPQAARAGRRLLDLLGPGAPAQVRRRPHQGPAARRADLRPLRHAPGQPRRLLRQRLRPLRQGLEGHGPGRGGRADQARGHPEPLRPEPQGGAGPAQLAGRGPLRPRADRRAPLQPLRLGQDERRARPGLQLGPGARRDAGGRRRRSCPRGSAPSGPARPSRSRRPATRRPTSSPSRSSASSCSWRPSTRAGSGPRSSS